MLTINPAKRVTATDALKHPWICVCVTHSLLLFPLNNVRHGKYHTLLLVFSATLHCGLNDAQTGDGGMSEEIQRQKETQGE